VTISVPAVLTRFSLRELMLAALAMVFAFGFVLRSCQRDRARDEAHDNAFRADSIAAFADTTRTVNAKAIKVLGDSLVGVERLAFQAEIRRDALDKALGRVTHALTNMSLAFRDLRAEGATEPVIDSGDTRTASFKVDSTPYHANAFVALPPAPLPGRFTLDVKLDAAKIGVRVQCGKESNTGIRPASATVTTSPWLTTEIETPKFSPEVCNPESHGFPWLRFFGGVLAGGLAGWGASR
jgi:hypothetical protein